MKITPCDDVVIRCFPFSEKHMPVVSSPHYALQRSFPDCASKRMICLSVVDVTAIWPHGSNMTLRWSGTTFLFGSGLFSHILPREFIFLKFKILSCPVNTTDPEDPLAEIDLEISIENILFLLISLCWSLNGSRSVTF